MPNLQRYQSFVRHEDNTNEVISAEHVNALQGVLEEVQQQNFRESDQTFLNRALFTIEQTPSANAMIVDLLENNEKINLSLSQGARYESKTHSMVFDDPQFLTATMTTTVITNPTEAPMRKILLLTDEYAPLGVNISYEFSYDNIQFFPINQNVGTPLVVDAPLDRGILRATIRRGSSSVIARIDAFALLFEDETYNFKFLDDGLDIDIESNWDGTIVG